MQGLNRTNLHLALSEAHVNEKLNHPFAANVNVWASMPTCMNMKLRRLHLAMPARLCASA